MRTGRATGTRTGTTDPCWLGPATTALLRGRQVNLLAAGPIAETLRHELATAVGPEGEVGGDLAGEPALVLARHDLLAGAAGVTGPLRRAVDAAAGLGEEGFVLVADGSTAAVVATGERGLLYGCSTWCGSATAAFAPARRAGSGTGPALRRRMLDHWDNRAVHPVMGQVERGYAGGSIFWQRRPAARRPRPGPRLRAAAGRRAASTRSGEQRQRARRPRRGC